MLPQCMEEPIFERRRTHRTTSNNRAMLEMAYETWVNVCTGWHVILNRAEATGNQDRIALARSKVAECEAEIRRIEALLGGSEVTA